MYENGDIRIKGIYYYNSVFILEVLPGKNITFVKEYDPAMPAMSDSETVIWQREDDRCYAISDSIMYPYLIDSCYLTFKDSTKNNRISEVEFSRFFNQLGDHNHIRDQLRRFTMPNFEDISPAYRRGSR